MADEEKKVKRDEGISVGRGIADVAGRMGEGVIDALAQRVPLLGAPLQAAFETPDYQDRQMRREMNKLAFARAQKESEEWDKNAGAREANRKAAEMRAKEYTDGAGDREDARALARRKLAFEHKRMDAAEENLPAEAELAKEQTRLGLSKTRLAQEQADAAYKRQVQSGYADGMRKDLQGNPAFETMSYADQDALLSSPRFQNLFDARYYLENIMGISNGDQAAFGRMDRVLQRAGMRLVDGPNGVKYLDIGKGGMSIPATKQGIDMIMRHVSGAAAEELNTRGAISDAATMGNPVKRSIAVRTKALMPYNGNDATKSYRMLQGIYDKSSDEEKGWHMFNQAITDFRSSGLPIDEKLAEFRPCLRFLKKMGYKLKDPNNPDPNQAEFIKIDTDETLNFSKFADLCREKDSLGARLDNAIQDSKKAAVARDRALFAREVGEMQQALREQRLANGVMKKNGSSANATKGNENSDDWFASEYGDKWKNLSETDKRRMQDVAKLYERAVNKLLKERGVRSVEQLPHEDLQKLSTIYKVLSNQ